MEKRKDNAEAQRTRRRVKKKGGRSKVWPLQRTASEGRPYRRRAQPGMAVPLGYFADLAFTWLKARVRRDL